MLIIYDENYENKDFSKDNNKEHKKFLNEKIYKASDTELSYRKINLLGVNNLLMEGKAKINSWRKFSLKDLIFIKIVETLRTFGITNSQLGSVKNCFFRKYYGRKLPSIKNGRLYGDYEYIIDHVVKLTRDHHLKIYLLIDEEFKCIFADEDYVIKSLGLVSFICINFDSIFTDILYQKYLGETHYIHNTIQLARVIENIPNKVRLISKKASNILDIIENNDYMSISIKKNGEEFLVKAEKINKTNKEQLLKMIEEKEFVDITVLKRDGNIVNIKVEEVFKV